MDERKCKRVMLRVAYDGTNYSGFQIQNSGVATIEGELTKALCDLTKEEISIIGGSRTDAGVHALDNIAVFDTTVRMPADRMAPALNTRLPEDIRVCSSIEVDPDFHPRHCDVIKTYEYKIYNAPVPSPLHRLYEHYSYTNFQVEDMQAAAKYLLGTHDFTSFASVYSQALTAVRTITDVSVTASQDQMPRVITIRVSGTGFLYNMVRIIAGTLMEVGRGAIASKDIPSILEALDRTAAGPTAPACGLTLCEYHFV